MEIWQLTDELKQRKEYLTSIGYDAYCLFCLPGVEITLAKEINNNFEEVIAMPILKMMHRSRNGIKFDSQEPLISSYIFIYTPKDFDVFKIRTSRFFFKLLDKDADSGKLINDDLKYANWVYETNGVLSVSEAININGKVKIISGPLKHLEGQIVEYSKRSRNCCIEIELLNQKIRTWLPFEWIDAK